MPSVRDILQENGLRLRNEQSGQQTTTCPQCSENRKPHNRRKPCLSVKIDAQGVCWLCHHCGWSGGAYYDGKERRESRETFRREKPGGYTALQRSSRSNWR